MAVPLIELANDSQPRTGTVSHDDYMAMRKFMGRSAERYLICLWETGYRLNEPRKLTWEKVYLEKGLLRLTADDVKEHWSRRTPISRELRQVLLELKREQEPRRFGRNPNPDGTVFTRKESGRPIESAAEKAGIPNAIAHDFRRSCITRWEAAGLPCAIAMACSGHRPASVHEKYVVLSDKQILDAFRDHGLLSPSSQDKQAVTAG